MRRNVPALLAVSLLASVLAGCAAPEPPAPAPAEDPRTRALQADWEQLQQRVQESEAQRQQLEQLRAEMERQLAQNQAAEQEMQRQLAALEDQNARLKSG